MERVILCLTGVGIFTAGLLFEDRQVVTSVLAVLAVAVLVLGIVLDRVRWFRLGPKGIEARLDRIEGKVEAVEERINALVPAATVHARTTIPQPTVVVDNPPTDDESAGP